MRGDVLAHLSEVRKGFTIGDDPSVYIVLHGACVPSVSEAFGLPIHQRVFPNKLLFSLVDLLFTSF